MRKGGEILSERTEDGRPIVVFYCREEGAETFTVELPVARYRFERKKEQAS